MEYALGLPTARLRASRTGDDMNNNHVADYLSRQYLGESEIKDFQVDINEPPNRRIRAVMTRKGHDTSVPCDIDLVAVEGKKDPEYQILLDCIRRGDKPSDYTNDTHLLRVIGDKYDEHNGYK